MRAYVMRQKVYAEVTGMSRNWKIRGPLMAVGNYVGAANAYVIILTMIAFAIAEVFIVS